MYLAIYSIILILFLTASIVAYIYKKREVALVSSIFFSQYAATLFDEERTQVIVEVIILVAASLAYLLGKFKDGRARN